MTSRSCVSINHISHEILRMEVPHINLFVQEDSLLEDAKKIISVLKPTWDLGETQIKFFTDGITNKLLGCSNKYDSRDVMLIRVYGNKTNLIIDRKTEIKNIKLLHLAELAPKLYGTFTNGFVYEYIPGVALTTVTCRLDNISELVAKKLAEMHCVRAGDHLKEPVLWSIITKFLGLVPLKFSADDKAKRFNELFPKKLKLEDEYSFLKQELSCLESPVVFCHNDLLLGNIIYNKEADTISFIDYEYAAYNYQAYDIANHFNEYAGVENFDHSLFPDEAYQKNWLKVYLQHYNSKSEDYEQVQVKEEDVNLLYLTVQKYTLASHFLWGVWCLVQAEHSLIDFDFLNYAFVRFQEYYRRKKLVFSL